MEKVILGDSVILKLQEDLIAPNVKEFNQNVVTMLKEKDEYSELILDLDNIENIDSVGVTFVVGLYKAINDEGRQFKVVNSSRDIIQLFKLMKLDEFFDMEE